jgi:hypothetical protein
VRVKVRLAEWGTSTGIHIIYPTRVEGKTKKKRQDKKTRQDKTTT